MVNKFKSTIWVFSRVFIISLVAVFLSENCIVAAQEAPLSALSRYRVFLLKHIPAQKGKEILEELEIGTVSQLPNSNTLLITAPSAELIKASAILELIDSEREYVIKSICSVSEAEQFPSNEQIAAGLSIDISIGTFASTPSDSAKERAIIDIHREYLLAVAPAEIIDNIISVALETAASQKVGEKQPQEFYQLTEPNKPTQRSEIDQLRETKELQPEEPVQAELYDDAEPDELFSQLLETLAEIEKKEVESQQAQLIPSEPNLAASVPTPREEPPEKYPGDIEETKSVKGPEELMELFSDLAGRSKPKETPEETEPSAGQGTRGARRQAALERDEAKVVREEPQPVTKETTPESDKSAEIERTFAEEDPYRPEPPTTGNEMLKINLPSKLDLVDLLGLVGEYMELDFMYDPKEVKGEVMLTFRGPIRVKDLYPLLESVLKFHGFVMARKGSLVVIVPQSKANEIDPELYFEPGRVKVGDVIITRIFELEHLGTAHARTFLNNMELGIRIEEVPETGTLIVIDFAYRMSRIEELLKMVDKPGKPRKFRFRRLEYTLAGNLATQVKNLAEQLGTVSITIAASTKKKAPTPSRTAPRPARPTTQPAQPSTTKAAAKPSVYLNADERTNRILMIGLDEDLNLVEELIDALDVEKQDLRTLRLYEIQNVGAQEVLNKLRELGIVGGQPAARSSTPGRITQRPTTTRTTTTTAAARPSTTTTAAAVEEALTGQPQVVIIEATNSLLVNATAEQHAQIALIIGYVDARPEQASIPYVVYPLENQDPIELAQTLNQLITETTQTQDKEGKILTTTTTSRLEEEDIVIIPDVKTYSLIVYASKKNQQWINAIIKELDEYRPQVLLDVTLVEITRDDEFSYDLDMISQIVPGAEQMKILDDTGFLSEFPGSTIIEAINTGAGLGNYPGAGGQGFLTKGRIQALFKIMEYRGYGRILARPKLLVNDNGEGTITTEDTIYVAQKQTKYIPTTSTGNTNQYSPDTTVTFQPYKAGIELKIQPHISKGDQLQLKITLNRTDFDLAGESSVNIGGEDFPKPLDTSTSNVDTIVTVPNGKTIILGGLEKTTQSKGGGKVPILGDIPFIGGLFRSASNASVQRRLYVFVKAHILRPGEELTGESDLEIVSAKNRATFEKYEQEMQEYEDWPGIKPKPMDPLRVLEVD